MMMRLVNIATRHRSLLEVNKIVLTTAAPEKVFQGMCRVLERLVIFERALLSVYDADGDALKIVDVYGAEQNTIFRMGHMLSRKATQTGWTFEHNKVFLRRNLAKEYRFPIDKVAMDEGFFSVCSVPLFVHGTNRGVVTVAAAKKNQLSRNDAEFIQELSNQIALTVSANSLKCATHKDTKLLCPRCIGSAGGRITVAKHRENLSDWGRRGGRGRRIPEGS